MELLSEVLKLSPWHIQWGGAERHAFFVGLFTYTSPQAGVGRIQSLRAVFACACVCIWVYVVERWIIVQNSPVIMFSVLSVVGNPLFTGLELLHLCAHV